jgi:multiple sugar transport system permease protein
MSSRHSHTQPFSYQKIFAFFAHISLVRDYVVICVALELICGFVLAYILAKSAWVRHTFVPLLILPILMPPVVVGLIWKVMLQGEFGILSYYLKKFNFLVDESVLSSTRLVLPAMIAVDIWQWTPFVMLVLLAGLVSLPKAPFEAALMDGASEWQIFKDVTIPLLWPIAIVAILIRLIDSFKEFDKVYILTGGGPSNITEMVSIYVYRTTFRYWDIGYGAALSFIVFVIISILTFFLYKHSSRT